MERPEKRRFNRLQEKSYLSCIKNSVNSRQYRSYYVSEKGREFDVLGGGRLSCALYVSSVLKDFNLIKKKHFTVYSTVQDMRSSGFKKISLGRRRPGDVLVWETVEDKTGRHAHIGFYLGGDQAVSNSARKRVIDKHHFTFKGKRAITAAYRPAWSK